MIKSSSFSIPPGPKPLPRAEALIIFKFRPLFDSLPLLAEGDLLESLPGELHLLVEGDLLLSLTGVEGFELVLRWLEVAFIVRGLVRPMEGLDLNSSLARPGEGN